MRKIICDAFGPNEQLRSQDCATPEANEDQALNQWWNCVF